MRRYYKLVLIGNLQICIVIHLGNNIFLNFLEERMTLFFLLDIADKLSLTHAYKNYMVLFGRSLI